MTLDHRLDALDEATRVLARFVGAETVRDVEALQGRAGERVGLGVDLTVVALAGSTGSGKSTLFNSLVGLDLAEVGVRRPTTTVALACVWGGVGADPLLDWLQVPARRRVARQSPLDDGAHPLDGLVLLDLPDHDSMVTEHRVEVDRLVGLVDVMVWVTDPVKYADALLHEEYLSTLTRHGSVVMVVLNQMDRLTPAEQRACLTDLRRLTRRDGLLDVEVMATSGATGVGLDALRSRLERVVDSRLAATERLSADVSALAARLRAEAGLAAFREHRAQPVDHEELAISDLDSLVRELVSALHLEQVVGDVHDRELRRATESLRWPVRRSATAAAEPSAVTSDPARMLVRSYLEQGLQPLPAAWADLVRHELLPVAESLPDRCAQAIGATAAAQRPAPDWWARHRQRQRVVLGGAVASAVVGLVLLGLVVAGAQVPVWALVVPLLLAGATGVEALRLNGRSQGAAEAWATECADATRGDLVGQIRRDADMSLDLPVRGQRRDLDTALTALATAGC